MPHNPLEYFRADERPAWIPVVKVNGEYENMTTGFSFVVYLRDGLSPPVLTKTTGITGATAGKVIVEWGTNELNIAPGSYRALLVASRDLDNAEWTIEDRLVIKAR